MSSPRLDVISGRWRAHLAGLAVVILAILLMFARDAGDMAHQWWSSSTYGHCLFVMPIVGWLVWQRRKAAAGVQPEAWRGGLALVGFASCLWLVGDAASISLLRHAALVGMIQAAILTALGPNVLKAVLFPVFYLVFLIPFGDEIVPAMQHITADIVMTLLRIAGLSATNDGILITTADGWFEVAEACSGVKFLVAMVAFGTLVANLCFRSTIRRAAFVVGCIALSVFANGVRAFATIYAAHLTNVTAATGFDHIVYGWFFFAFTMGAAFFLGRPFFDQAPVPVLSVRTGSPAAAQRSPAATMVGTLALPALALGWNMMATARSVMPLPNIIRLPDVPGWSRATAGTGPRWAPRLDGADHVLFGRYQSGDGKAVDLGIAIYGSQGRGRVMTSYGQGAIDPDGPWRRVDAPGQGGMVVMRGPGGVRRRALTFYVVDGRVMSDVMTAKLNSVWSRLLGRSAPSGVFVVSAVEPDAARALSAFVARFGPLDRRMDALVAAARGR